MAQITINDDYRYKGMYRNYSASLDSNVDWEPVTENADSNKYVQINNVKFYNSAVLTINDECYFFIVSEQSGYFRFKYTWASSTYTYEITRSSGNGLYGARADDFQTTTVGGVLIYYNDSRSYSNNRCNIVGLPIFTSPSEFVAYISQAVTPPYNWQSVPSISGKNGILSLPVLVSTDGEPVSSGSASDFSALPSGTKVRTLADANI